MPGTVPTHQLPKVEGEDSLTDLGGGELWEVLSHPGPPGGQVPEHSLGPQAFSAREKSPTLSKLCLKTKNTLERDWTWLFLKIRKISFLHATHLYEDPREPGRSPGCHAKLGAKENVGIWSVIAGTASSEINGMSANNHSSFLGQSGQGRPGPAPPTLRRCSGPHSGC